MVRKRKQESAKAQGAGIVVLTKLQTTLLTSAYQKEASQGWYSKEPSKDLGVSLDGGIPKSSIFIGFSIINHPFWGTPIFGNTHLCTHFLADFLEMHHLLSLIIWITQLFFAATQPLRLCRASYRCPNCTTKGRTAVTLDLRAMTSSHN